MKMENNEKMQETIDLREVVLTLWKNRKKFFLIVPIVFALSCLWIFPKPRYYVASISLAPETSGTEVGGGLASIASSFGFSLGGGGNDAIYPTLYPSLFESPVFLCELLNISVTTDDGELNTSYYIYLLKHQKKNWLLQPFKKGISSIKKLFVEKKPGAGDPSDIDPFRLTETELEILEKMQSNITCSLDKKTDVTTISVQDQDPYIAACMADSVSVRLQRFITQYRTSKARLDVDYYQTLSDSALVEYNAALQAYGEYCDANLNATRQTVISRKEQLQNELSLKQTTYQAYQAQLQAMKSKVQENTPAFTILKSASVPVKPAGPKRVIFVVAMCMLACFAEAVYLTRDLIFKKAE